MVVVVVVGGGDDDDDDDEGDRQRQTYRLGIWWGGVAFSFVKLVNLFDARGPSRQGNAPTSSYLESTGVRHSLPYTIKFGFISI